MCIRDRLNIASMFSRPPVDILPFKFEFLSTLDKIIFFKLKVEILGIYDFNKACLLYTSKSNIEKHTKSN